MMKMLTSYFVGLWLLLMAEATQQDYDEAIHPYNTTSTRTKRFMLKRPYLWPKALVPFYFDPSSLQEQPEILRVIAYVEDQSCVRFLPWNSDVHTQHGLSHKARVTFMRNNNKCESGQGFRENGVKTSCCDGDKCLHEIGHALGFIHEQANGARPGWIDVLNNNIPAEMRGLYAIGRNNRFNYTDIYDISTIMHYSQLYYFETGPVFAKDFPELSVGHQDFYYFKQMAEGYRCQDMPQCQGRDLGCQNDGFQTIQHGECRCVCPAGLDPDNKCRTPLKRVKTTGWPKGRYGLLKLKSGCPLGGEFKEGKLMEHGSVASYMSSNNQMSGYVNNTDTLLEFCTRTTEDVDHADDPDGDQDGPPFNWPLGNYCIFMAGGQCPKDFTFKFINYTVDNHTTHGVVPDLQNGRMNLCCQFKGFQRQPAPFPVDKPFTLIQHPLDQCQEVEGMRYTQVSFTQFSLSFVKLDDDLWKWGRHHPWAFNVPLCQYTPVDMNCGGSFTVGKSRPGVTIDVSGAGRKDLQCTWVVKGDSDKGTMVLDFERFDVGPVDRMTECQDKVEVRHALIGQRGLEYCGRMEHSIRSITDKMAIRFSTIGDSQSSFKAKVKWIPYDEMCYDEKHGGARYDGNVNYTRTFETCLPWAQMTECTHNPFTGIDATDRMEQLTGNACRNPDNSFRPWCYTDKAGCKRNYCDVCGLETPYDHMENCDKLKETGFCTRDASIAIKYCAATCFQQLPTTPLTRKHSEVTCSPPIKPVDGVFTAPSKPSYSLGESVSFRCKTGRSVVSTQCMTSGQWTKVTTACKACPPDYVQYRDQCFGIIDNENYVLFSEAIRTCDKLEGRLPTPQNEEDSNIIDRLTNSYGDSPYLRDVWLGITYKEGAWVYENGTSVSWTNWDENEPKTLNADEDNCVGMRAKSLKWRVTNCRYSNPVVCSIPVWVSSECRDMAGEDKCQGLILDRPELCNDLPDFAKTSCAKSCGVCSTRKVMCPVTTDQHSKTKPAVTKNGFPAIYVGETITYSCQDFKFPVKGHSTRTCMSNGKLNGQPLECGDCPLGFTLVDNDCHGLIPGKPRTFTQAKQECHKLQGFIAMPKTRAQVYVVSKLGLGTNVWIGADDSVTEGTFQWQDGSSVPWNTLRSGDPKSMDEDMDCVYMNEHKVLVNVDCDKPKLTTVCTIPKSDDDLCYDMRDGGVSYDGAVNYTRTFQPCLPWSKVTGCPHHAFNKGDEQDNLVGNACRNPDQSYRPWCYTDQAGCKRNYCDVCGNESPKKDARTDCVLFKSKGLCARDAAKALRDCAVTCWDSLPGREPALPYPEIHCGPPTPPMDGSLVGTARRSYNIGESVEYKCKLADWSVFARCMTSGQWSRTGLACPACPLDYIHRGDHCIHLAKVRVPYQSAREQCGQKGGRVAVPTSIEENNYFIHLAGKLNSIWIGLTDSDQEGRWVDENGHEPTWTKWNPGAPVKDKSRNCVTMYGRAKTWLDAYCSNPYLYLCYVPTLNSDVCEDFLIDQCPQLLAEEPRMCQDRPEFAKLRCAKTCGICSSGVGSCPLPNLNPNVVLVKPKSDIVVGDFVEYSCTSDTYRIDGDEVRACLPNGELTGSPLQCGDCPAGFKLVSNACTGPVEGKLLTYAEAKDECWKIGGFVSIPKNVAENAVISELGDGYFTWIGATDVTNEDSFIGDDGHPIGWTNWSNHDHVDSKNTEDKNCAVMDPQKSWIHVRCGGTKYRTVCSVPMEGRECRHVLNGQCYRLAGDTPRVIMTYDDGVSVCKNMGGKMAAPRNQNEVTFIRDFMVKDGAGQKVWIGITDQVAEGTWTYQDGNVINWSNWLPGEPNNYGLGEDCAVQETDSKWLDMSCGYKYPVMCVVDKRIPPFGTQCPPPVPPSDASLVSNSLHGEYFMGDMVEYQCHMGPYKIYSRCMSNNRWSDSDLACKNCPGTYYNGHCYRTFHSKLAHDRSVEFCNSIGYSLVAPKSKVETLLMTKITKAGMIWMGATDKKTEGQWLYEDGTNVTWTNWNINEPNDYGERGEDCAMMTVSNGKWADMRCGFQYQGPVCVKKIDVQ